MHVRGNAAPDPSPSSAQVEQDALKSQPQLRGDFAQGDHKHTDQAVYDASCNVEPAMQSKHGDAYQPRTQSAYAHPRTPMDTVPRSMEEFMSRIIHTVKTSGTRLAVYLRGWDTFRAYSTGSVSEPPACKCCVRNAAKYRGSKEDPPPRRGLFPCLPLPGIRDSLEDRYINFILGVSSFVAVGGNPVPWSAFRRSTSKEHESLIAHIKRQLHDFFEGCSGLDPYEALGSGRSGRLLADALERACADCPIPSLHGSTGIATGTRVEDMLPCAITPGELRD